MREKGGGRSKREKKRILFRGRGTWETRVNACKGVMSCELFILLIRIINEFNNNNHQYNHNHHQKPFWKIKIQTMLTPYECYVRAYAVGG